MIVVDCTVVVDALTGVDGTDDLRTLLSGEQLAAPSLLDYEVVSVLRSLTARGALTAPRAFDVLTDFDDLRIRRWPSSDGMRRRSLQLRDNVSAYDATYLALAEALECRLVTRDLRLARTVGHDVTVEVR